MSKRQDDILYDDVKLQISNYIFAEGEHYQNDTPASAMRAKCVLELMRTEFKTIRLAQLGSSEFPRFIARLKQLPKIRNKQRS